MTLFVKIGRRVPKSWVKRQVAKIQSLLSFQENMWIMLHQSFNLAKRRCLESSNPKMVFEIIKKEENEDMLYKLEWLVIVVQGTSDQENEEYQDILKINDAMVKRYEKHKISRSDLDNNDNLKKMFKTKLLSKEQLVKVFDTGNRAVGQQTIAEKLLELGIITDIQLVEDYHSRESLSMDS